MLKYSKKTQVSIKEANNYPIIQAKNFFERHIGYIFPKHHINNNKLCFDDKNFKNTYLKRRESSSKKIIEKFNSIDRNSLNKDEKLLLDYFQIEWLSVNNLYEDKDRSIKIKVWGVQSKYIEHLEKGYLSPSELKAQKKQKVKQNKRTKSGWIILIIVLSFMTCFSKINNNNKKKQQAKERIEAIKERREAREQERNANLKKYAWDVLDSKIILNNSENEIKEFLKGGKMRHSISNNSENEIEMIVQTVKYYKINWWGTKTNELLFEIQDTILLDIDSPKGKPGNTNIYFHPSTFTNKTNEQQYIKNYYVEIYGYISTLD